MNHITQDAARAIFSEVTKAGKGFATTQDVMNAAIQHYINQQTKELPVLPAHIADVLVITGQSTHKHMQAGQYYYTSSQLQAYGAACAAHAREMALSEAVEQVTTLYEGDEAPYLIDICKAIEALKDK